MQIIAPLAGSPEAERELAVLVGQSFEVLRVFGKQPEQLKTITRTFLMMLGDYPILRVKAAFVAWMRTNNEMPTPADIISLIDGHDDDWRWVTACLDQIHNGGRVADWAEPKLVKLLGRNWRDYV